MATGLAVAWWQNKKQTHKQKALLPKDNALVEVKQETVTQSEILSNFEEASHYKKTSLLALGLAGSGTLFYAPLTYLSIPILSYNYFHFLKKTYHSVLIEKKVAVGVFEAIGISAGLIMQNYLLAAFMFSMYFTSRELILKTRRNAQLSFSNVFGDLPKQIWVLKDGVELEVSLQDVQLTDIVIIRSGEIIAVDGIIVSGEGLVDQHILTGEGQAIEKNISDQVFTSTLLLSGCLHVQVEKQGQETVTGQLIEILEKTAKFNNHVQSRGDKIVEKGAGISLLTTSVALPFVGLSHALALTYAGFGYQMRLAAPLTVMNYLSIASNHGILIKDGLGLERLRDIDTVVFDKTGTLTEEIPTVERVLACHTIDTDTLLQYAGSAEQYQKHPIAQAIVHKVKADGYTVLPLIDSHYEIGHGLRAEIKTETKHQIILLGSVRFMNALEVEIPVSIAAFQQECALKGHSLVYMADNQKNLLGVIELAATIRPEAYQMVEQLHQMGKQLCIISGDQTAPTQHLANLLKIKHYYAETLPEDKAKIIETLQAEGKQICFIGDGINDVVALQTADVSISLQGAATIATDTANIVLIHPDLLSIPYLITMSEELYGRMNTSVMMNTVSSITCVSGILFLGMNIGGAVLLYYGSLGANLGNAMLPLLKNQQSKNKQ